jgi:hypothetical protein
MTVALAGGWLRSLVARDSGLSLDIQLSESVPEPAGTAADHCKGSALAYDALFVVPLTMRETDVLKRLGDRPPSMMGISSCP